MKVGDSNGAHPTNGANPTNLTNTTNGAHPTNGDIELTSLKIPRPKVSPKPGNVPSWVPYEMAWTETPFLFLFAKVLPHWYRIRNALLRNPFFDARAPRHIPGGASGKGPWWVKYWHNSLTLGEILFILPILGYTIGCGAAALVNHWKMDVTGTVAGVPVVFVLMLASRNSIFTFLLGIPFERALFWHKMIGSLSVVTLSWIHGYPPLSHFGTHRNSIFTFLLGIPFERALFWHKMIRSLSVVTLSWIHGYPPLSHFGTHRNSIFTFLLGIPFERALFWHKMIGSLSVVTLSWIHGYPPLFHFGTHRNSIFTFLLGIPFERALFWHKMIGSLSVVTLSWIHGYPPFFHFSTHRNSIFTFLLGIPFERALFWHKMIGSLFVVTLSWIHGYPPLSHFGEPPPPLPNGQVREERVMNVVISGLVLACVFTSFTVFSTWFLRRKLFNVFYVIHIILVILACIFAGLHGFYFIFVGVGVWGVDVIIRFFYLTLLTAPKTCTATRLPANVIRLSWKRPKGSLFKYSAGQYAFIMVPGVNIFEWHPFSLSSSPHQDFVSVHIRVLGNWTKALYDLIESKGGGPVEITSFWEGPYGAPEIDVDGPKYQMFLLISGGIGITPLQSMANSLAYQHEEEGRPMKKVWFVWSCADKYMVGANFEHDGAWRGSDSPPQLPLSFQPNILNTRIHTDKALDKHNPATATPVSKDGEVLHTEFYLTRVRTAAELEGANIKPELQPFVKFGRPDLPEIFATFRAYALGVGEERVGVLACGPGPLVDDVRRLCGNESKDGVSFDYHAEIFEF